MIVNAGSQDVSTYFVLRKATDNTELTGVTITDIDLTYTRSGADHVLKVDATALTTPDAAHADNKAIEVDATDCPGLYRVDWPDAAFATGVKQVVLTVKYATAFTEHLLVELDPPANITRIGGDVQSLTDLKDFADNGYNPMTHQVEGVKLVDITTTNSDMATGFATPTNVSDTQALIITQVNENEAKLDAMQGNVTSILSNTNEVHGLITSDKIAAQVKGMDADVLTASALNTDAVAEIATVIMAKTVDGSIDVTKALNMMVALLAGDMTKTDNTYTFKDQSGVVVFTALMSSTERNGTVA